jgi:DNA modification methylase
MCGSTPTLLLDSGSASGNPLPGAKVKKNLVNISSPITDRTLKIEYRPIESLSPNPSNARIHTDRQIRQIAASITTFGLNWPILIEQTGVVIAGHARLEACKLLRRADIPVILIDHLTEHQKVAFALADNKLTENSTWDERLLRDQLQILTDAELDFNLDVIGFEVAEIDMIVESVDSPGPNLIDSADAEIEPVLSKPVSRRGDVWRLGEHRILCGDALCKDDYRKLMGEKRADAVFTDPPYNVPISGHAGGKGKVQHREFAMASGEMSPSDFTEFLMNVCELLAANSSPESLIYIFMDWRHMGELLTAGRAAFADLRNLCVWVKNNGGMGSLYRSQHELIFLFGNGGSHRNNVQLGKFGRSRTNVWNYPGVNSFSRSTDEGNLLALHPTVKPVNLVADAIKDCTAHRGLVLDPFLGSGTTVIAAARTGRVCYAMDIDPTYVDAAVRRCQKHAGLTAINESTGETFERCEETAHASE